MAPDAEAEARRIKAGILDIVSASVLYFKPHVTNYFLVAGRFVRYTEYLGVCGETGSIANIGQVTS